MSNKKSDGWNLLKLFSTRVVNSVRNGEISVQHRLGQTQIVVGGYFQSGIYLKTMWKQALEHLPPTFPADSVLMLGLGGGSAIGPIHERFPTAQISAVEWDPAMVHLARELNLFAESIQPQIHVGDAFELLPQLAQQFDLILIDLFTGDVAEKRLATAEMIASIAKVTKNSGAVILNAFKDLELIDRFTEQLEHQANWRYKYNRLALFTHASALSTRIW